MTNPLPYSLACVGLFTAITTTTGCRPVASKTQNTASLTISGAGFRHPVSSEPRSGESTGFDPQAGIYPGMRGERPLPLSRVQADTNGGTLPEATVSSASSDHISIAGT